MATENRRCGSWVVAFVCVALTGCAHASLEAENRLRWLRLESPQVTLTTTLNDAEARDAFDTLAHDVAIISTVLGQSAPHIDVVVFDDELGFRQLFGHEAFLTRNALDVSHPLVVLSGREFVWKSGDARTVETSAARYLVAHALTQQVFRVTAPWFERGLVEWLEPLQRVDDGVVFGNRNDDLLDTLHPRDRTPVSFVPIGAMLDGEPSIVSSPLFSASAWLFVHFLVNAHPQAWQRFLTELTTVGAQFDEAVDHLRAALDLAHLDAELRDYVARGTFSTTKLSLDEPPGPQTVELTGEAWALLRAQLWSAAGDATRAQSALREGLGLAPGSDALRLHMLAYVSANDLPAFVADWARWSLTASTSSPVRELQRALGADLAVVPTKDTTQREALASSLQKKGLFNAALRLVHDAEADSVALYDLRDTEAAVLAGLGRWDEAIEASREAVQRARHAGITPAWYQSRLEAFIRHELPKH